MYGGYKVIKKIAPVALGVALLAVVVGQTYGEITGHVIFGPVIFPAGIMICLITAIFYYRPKWKKHRQLLAADTSARSKERKHRYLMYVGIGLIIPCFVFTALSRYLLIHDMPHWTIIASLVSAILSFVVGAILIMARFVAWWTRYFGQIYRR